MMKFKQALAAFFISAFLMSTTASSDPVKRFKPGDQTIAEIASASPETFSTLVAALVCTELLGAVSDPEAEITVFAPTNQAFGELGLNAGNICSTFEKETLQEILLYHVVDERRPSPSVINGNNKLIEMLSGGYIYPEGNGSLNITDATGASVTIAAPDQLASNGIVHVIGGVLLPF
jgi:transforming growth factor-beta-induced protein